jgi:VanZ family protein
MQSNSLLNRLYNRLQEQTFLYLYVPLTLYWIAMFIGTTLPTDHVPKFFNAQDKLEHFLAYFGLAVMIYLWLHFQKVNLKFRQNGLLFSVLIVLTYAAFDELHQTLIPGRVCDIIDWIADALGGITGIGLVYFFIKSNRLKNAEAELSS